MSLGCWLAPAQRHRTCWEYPLSGSHCEQSDRRQPPVPWAPPFPVRPFQNSTQEPHRNSPLEKTADNPHGNLWPAQKSSANSNSTVEEAFSSLLTGIVCDALANALGRYVLDILASKGLLDDSDHPKQFDRGLQSLSGNGASVLERIVVKDLYRKLSIPYNSDAGFDYEKSLETAKEVCFVESRLK